MPMIIIRALMCALIFFTGAFGTQWFITKQWTKGFMMLGSLVASAIVPFWYGLHVIVWFGSMITIQFGLKEKIEQAWGIELD